MPLQYNFQVLFDASPNAYELLEDDWNPWLAECTSKMREMEVKVKSLQN